MKHLTVMDKMGRAFGKAGLKLKKHSPEILVVTGIVGVVASAVLACRATTKANAILTDAKRNINTINNWEEHKAELPADYSNEDCKKDIKIIQAQTGLQLVKTYAPSVVLGALSIGCILASNNMLHKRNVALAAAYTTVDNSFKNYRKRVIDRFGKELDKELKYNIKTKEVEEKVVDEKGKEKTVKKTVDVVGPLDGVSEFAKFYDVGCNGWTKDPEHNLWFLRQQQAWANDKLKAQGYLFLNDVYEMLGINKTKAGQIAGWIYDENKPNGDNYVDFGIYNTHREANRDFVNGYERTILLDFNVDGNILDLI